MTEPVVFAADTSHARLPMLFAGQAQKEFFVNQAFVVLDALASGAIINSSPEPPVGASDGDSYRITSPATADWSQYADHIAVMTGGSWHFIPPAEGMLVFDRERGQWLCYRGEWIGEFSPPMAGGGAVIDVEARAVLAELIESLERLGLLAPAAG